MDQINKMVGESGGPDSNRCFFTGFMTYIGAGLILTLTLVSCGGGTKIPEQGEWRGILHLQGQELPFNFELCLRGDGGEILIINGEERIRLEEVEMVADSLRIPMHIFDTEILAGFTDNSMKGHWQKNYLDNYIIPFSAHFGETFRFSDHPEKPAYDISGRWEVYFLSGSDSSLAVGIFNQKEGHVSGTFLKPTGDYRYLDGELDGDSLKLSTFDGEHAYLFKALMVSRDKIQGIYWSGQSWNQPWVAFRNPFIDLPDPDSLTFLKPGYSRIRFRLPDLDGHMVSLDDPRFRDKVVIIQIFGTWCPNCMDETRFLSAWYNENRDQEVEIVALAFERKDDIQYARERINRMKEKFNINYEFLFGGRSDKSVAAGVLPMLNTVVSFPTLIIIDQKGKVRKIHTGFNGPGTGQLYEKYVEEFNLFMEKLLEE